MAEKVQSVEAKITPPSLAAVFAENVELTKDKATPSVAQTTPPATPLLYARSWRAQPCSCEFSAAEGASLTSGGWIVSCLLAHKFVSFVSLGGRAERICQRREPGEDTVVAATA